MSDTLDRRSFLTTTAAAGLGLAVLGAMPGRGGAAPLSGPAPAEPFRAKPLDKIRIGFIGVGNRGKGHLALLLKLDKVEIKAICDIIPAKVELALNMVVRAGQPKPEGYANGPQDYKKLCAREDIDLVYIVTPWEWHTPMCLAAMNAGKHAATEVPMAVTLEECWQLVETAEKTGRHCVMLENCCYGRLELLTLNLTRKGMLGELLHGECGYLHDLRSLKLVNGYEGDWRGEHSIRRNGNLYPTHGLGPIAECMNINRGDQFDYLVSMSGKSRGLSKYAAEHLGPDSKWAKRKFALGDINTTLIRTRNGCTIYVGHNCDSPRPYSRISTLQGTQGIVSGYPDRVYIEGRSPNDLWQTAEEFYKEFDHPLWKKHMVEAAGAGHGGMDYFVNYRLVECLLRGEPTDQNVYDGAAWSVVSALTEQSVANNSRPVEFPDFTRGRWKTNPPLGIVEG